jgi:colicin import membrane protein
MPLDGAIRLLPGNATGARRAAGLALDRADATLRTVIATILGDPVLREDAERRRSAAEQRESALRLRTGSERKGEQADARLAERQEQATRQREQANQRAEARRQEAAREAEQEKRRAAKVETERVQSSRRTVKGRQQALNERAAKDRLETLIAKTEAMSQKDKELIARDEARRLRGAASRTKAQRKSR